MQSKSVYLQPNHQNQKYRLCDSLAPFVIGAMMKHLGLDYNTFMSELGEMVQDGRIGQACDEASEWICDNLDLTNLVDFPNPEFSWKQLIRAKAKPPVTADDCI